MSFTHTHTHMHTHTHTHTHKINVSHPAAKSMIEIARTQDEEVGDGTTSVIILGECPCLKMRGR